MEKVGRSERILVTQRHVDGVKIHFIKRTFQNYSTIVTEREKKTMRDATGRTLRKSRH